MNCNISRILSPHLRAGAAICLSGQNPGLITPRAAASSPIWPCSGRGLPCGPDCSGARWSLTPPFHPCRTPKRPAVCSLLRFPSRGVAPATSFLKKDFLPCGVRTFLFAKQSGRRCNSHTYYNIRGAKMQVIFSFFAWETRERGRRGAVVRERERFFVFFLFRRLQSVLPRDTLF